MTATPSNEPELPVVQLTRIEGTLNLIKYQHETMFSRVDNLATDMSKLKTDVHTLQLEAVARDGLARTVATTLKDADAAQIVKNDQKWSPLTRIIAISSLLVYISTMYFMFNK